MRPTIAYIEQKFDEFNQLIFDGKLPKIPVELSNAKSFLGRCVYRRKRNFWGKWENVDFRLRISKRLDLPEEEVEDTIIHEMIHYYIGVNQLKDTSAHGRLFRQIMKEVNQRFGRHVAISHKSTPQEREQLADHSPRPHVVAVVHMKNGKTGLKVLPRTVSSILKYVRGVSQAREVESLELYATDNPFFNRYPTSAALRVHPIGLEELQQHLAGAHPIRYDGLCLSLS